MWKKKLRRLGVSDDTVKDEVRAWVMAPVWYDPEEIARKLDLPLEQVSKVIGVMIRLGEIHPRTLK